ncbi:MAG TPA: MFS transporter [Streptosporangiaceae bacterium]|nr:MFS transporter [Streptosporangiaceae bacterium]
MTTGHAGVRAGRREWAGLAVLCLPSMLATVDINVVVLALPRIAASLHAGAIEQLWVSDIYAFMIAGFLVTMGTLGDRAGRRRVLLLGAAGFIAASVFAAFATSAPMLIAARALIGVAGATLMPSVLALIRNMFKDPRQMSAAMGVWSMSIMVGLLAGPVVGGLLLNAFWWGSVFLIAVPVMGALLLLGPVLVPESRDPHAGRLDPLSVVLWLAGVLPVVYGIKELARNGWQPLPAVVAAAGAVCVVLFVRRQRVLPSPLLDLRLFTSRALSVTCLLVLLMTIVLAGTALEATLFMQAVKGLTPLHVALLTLIPAGVMIVASNAAPAVARVARPGFVLAAAAVAAAAGMVVIAQQGVTAGVAVLITGMTVMFVCGGTIGPLSGFLIMTAVPPEKAGSAGSLSSTSGELGQALGVAILGVLGTAVYRAQVEIPAGIPARAAAVARQSIIGTASAARHIPGQSGAALLRSADTAFVAGLHVVAVVGAVVFAGLAVLAGIGLRHVPPITGFSGMPPPGEVSTADEAGVSRVAAA